MAGTTTTPAGTGTGAGTSTTPKASTPKWSPDEGPLFNAAAATAAEVTTGKAAVTAAAAALTAEQNAGKAAMTAYAKSEPKFDNGTVNQKAP